MSKLFNKLPGYKTTPPGRERWVLRQAPFWTVMGTFSILMPSILVRLFPDQPQAVGISGSVGFIDINSATNLNEKAPRFLKGLLYNCWVCTILLHHSLC